MAYQHVAQYKDDPWAQLFMTTQRGGRSAAPAFGQSGWGSQLSWLGFNEPQFLDWKNAMMGSMGGGTPSTPPATPLNNTPLPWTPTGGSTPTMQGILNSTPGRVPSRATSRPMVPQGAGQAPQIPEQIANVMAQRQMRIPGITS